MFLHGPTSWASTSVSLARCSTPITNLDRPIPRATSRLSHRYMSLPKSEPVALELTQFLQPVESTTRRLLSTREGHASCEQYDIGSASLEMALAQ
eukprot:m.100773 g.100773  ORF g.100773 m.100773 type:complete len:95 (-) comp15141_c0_seq3:1135-1419(-)